MIQFCIYREKFENDKFWKEFIALRPQLINGEFSNSLINKIIDTYENNDYPIRLAMILAKLKFWGFIDEEKLLNVIGKNLVQIYHSIKGLEIGVGSKQELLLCLGAKTSNKILNVSQYEFEKRTLPYNPKYELEDISSKDTILYVPRLSGYFSIIENLIVASYIAYRNNKKIVVYDKNWWPYSIQFSKIFGDIFNLTSNTNYTDVLDFDSMRTYTSELLNYNVDEVEYYTAYKENFYKRIKNKIHNFLLDNTIDMPKGDYASIFLRGGDKIRQESIHIPNRFFRNDIDKLEDTDLYLLSDDYSLAENLKNDLGKGDILVSKNKKGYDLFHRTNNDDLLELMKNYLIMSNAKYSLGCPSSNIVNGANWSNESDIGYRSLIQSSTAYRYFLI